MQRLQLEFQSAPRGMDHTFDVPDIATALVVADINLAQGEARIRSDGKLLARLEKRHSVGHAPYWHVS